MHEKREPRPAREHAQAHGQVRAASAGCAAAGIVCGEERVCGGVECKAAAEAEDSATGVVGEGKCECLRLTARRDLRVRVSEAELADAESTDMTIRESHANTCLAPDPSTGRLATLEESGARSRGYGLACQPLCSCPPVSNCALHMCRGLEAFYIKSGVDTYHGIRCVF